MDALTEVGRTTSANFMTRERSDARMAQAEAKVRDRDNKIRTLQENLAAREADIIAKDNESMKTIRSAQTYLHFVNTPSSLYSPIRSQSRNRKQQANYTTRTTNEQGREHTAKSALEQHNRIAKTRLGAKTYAELHDNMPI